MTTLRAGYADDLPQITAIYAHHVHDGAGSFETEALTLATFAIQTVATDKINQP